mmetsp:Transcript_5921/g.5567  ORF Transcript_5921/g.5567 Transcript_5921/m.5567 type:complete len:91 (+) Transcript_5921:198-470(+)
MAKNYQSQIELGEYKKKGIDKKRITMKKFPRLSTEEVENLSIKNLPQNSFMGSKKKLSQEQIEFLRKEQENQAKMEESKSRHKKTPAILK